MPVSDFMTANRAVSGLIRSLPQALADELADATATPVPPEALVNASELLFARRADLTAADAETAAEVVEFCTQNGWYGLGVANRGGLMAAALRRGGVQPSDPEPLARWTPAETVEETPVEGE